MLGDAGWGFCDGRGRRAHWGRPKRGFVAVVVGARVAAAWGRGFCGDRDRRDVGRGGACSGGVGRGGFRSAAVGSVGGGETGRAAEGLWVAGKRVRRPGEVEGRRGAPVV
jgi:hypothetical protein